VTGVATPGRRLAIAVETVLATALVVVLAPGRRGFFDLAVYQGATRYWLSGGPLYDYLVPGSPYGFTYPPFAALALSPLAALGWYTAIAASLMLNVCVAAWLVYRYVGPRWFPYCLAACAVTLLVPVRDTISFGQVNLVLLLLVSLDADRLGKSRWAGIGIGLAAAIKLTPALFIGYLLVARQYRAAGVAAGTAAGVTLLTVVVAPRESLAFWGRAVWDTARVGQLGHVANQSLRGLVERLEVPHPSLWWLVAVGIVVAAWVIRSRHAAAAGDYETGFALTGVACCLISPVSWVHHLVWLLPALFLLARAAMAARQPRLLVLGAATYLPLCTGAVWLWYGAPPSPTSFVGANLYVWVAIALLAGLPVEHRRTRPGQWLPWPSRDPIRGRTVLLARKRPP
jgi:alpha-1,2-mannosyltransferase